MTPQQRARATVELWQKLSGDSSSDASELYTEAAVVAKKGHSTRTPSLAMKTWLAAPPTACRASAARL